MSKIKNSIYGLALGDALGYRTEFLSFENIVNLYADENPALLEDDLLISDDTQMSIYLIEGFQDAYDEDKPFDKQTDELTKSIAWSFISWLKDPDNHRAPGAACINSLQILNRELKTNPDSKDYLIGGRSASDSKGSGTIMRSPWIGILHAKRIIPNADLEAFCAMQSSLTHTHPTALRASYLTALLTSKLYNDEIFPSQLKEFSLELCAKNKGDKGWDELSEALHRIDNLPKNFASLSASEFDPSSVLGDRGTAEDVLVNAIGIIDVFGDTPVEVLRRSMFTSGDSDTIGAVAGGIIGAYYGTDIWSKIKHLVEKEYVSRLEETSTFLSQL